MATYDEAMQTLKLTSRTFYLPIVKLPGGLRDAVAAGYLCLRSIDEIEDHPTLSGADKASLLGGISRILQSQTSVETFAHDEFTQLFKDFREELPEVTLRIGEWACYAPTFIAPRVWEATATMADRMAQWATVNWRVSNKSDLDRYTYGVAGAVGLLLCDIWAWF